MFLLLQICFYFYHRDSMKYLSRENQADIIEPFNTTYRYRYDLLNIDNVHSEQMVN